MTTLKLTRLNNANIGKLCEMKSSLRDFLKEDTDLENLETILDFQDTDGSFKLFATYEIPSDARVDFCHEPTYICSAILMKAYLTGDSALKEKVEAPLRKALRMCRCRNLRGHGYEALEGQIEALNILMEGGLREFIDLHPELNPKFTKMILNIINEFGMLEAEGRFKGPWGEDFKEEILKINRYFTTRKVFVYGTLMKGESNHGFLENSSFLQSTSIDGYEMYDVGWYPAIIPGEGRIIGELYEVPEDDMPMIDGLEGEGSLYIRKCEMTADGSLAYIYEFLQDIDGLERISSWKDYVWYVSYGSNMLYDRFLCYIKGGNFEGSSSWRMACDDTSSPIEARPVEIQYDMYFGNTSASWDFGGVSFLDTTRKGHALGVAYLITREQFEHVAAEENCGRFPDGYGSWYENIRTLGEMDGFEMLTISNDELRPYNKPSEGYSDTIRRGLMENWPDMSEEDIDNYIDGCIRNQFNSINY